MRGFQWLVRCWVVKAFGIEVLRDRRERALRLIEEAVELGQAIGLDALEVQRLVAYVYSRPVGEPSQEVGGVLVTALAAAEALGLEAEDCLRTEVERINQPDVVEKCRANQFVKRVVGVTSAR